MIQPNYKTFCKLARQGNLVPVYETVTADLLTPVGAYLRLARNARYSCLLESVEGGETIARYTFIGANPRKYSVRAGGPVKLNARARARKLPAIRLKSCAVSSGATSPCACRGCRR